MTLAELLDRCAPRPSRQGDLLIAVCREIIPSVCGLPAPAPITSFKPGMSLVRPLEGLPDAPTKNRGFHTLDNLVIHLLRSPVGDIHAAGDEATTRVRVRTGWRAWREGLRQNPGPQFGVLLRACLKRVGFVQNHLQGRPP